MNIPSNVEDDEIVCQCFQVNENTIRAAIAKDNLKEIDEITEKCEAGGGCHSCHILLQLFIDEHQKNFTSTKDLIHDHGNKIKKSGILSRFFKKTNPNSS